MDFRRLPQTRTRDTCVFGADTGSSQLYRRGRLADIKNHDFRFAEAADLERCTAGCIGTESKPVSIGNVAPGIRQFSPVNVILIRRGRFIARGAQGFNRQGVYSRVE